MKKNASEEDEEKEKTKEDENEKETKNKIDHTTQKIQQIVRHRNSSNVTA